jgi:hypothetical protein
VPIRLQQFLNTLPHVALLLKPKPATHKIWMEEQLTRLSQGLQGAKGQPIILFIGPATTESCGLRVGRSPDDYGSAVSRRLLSYLSRSSSCTMATITLDSLINEIWSNLGHSV